MNTGRSFVRSLIRQHTKLTRDHLTPEISLHLITPECQLWTAHVDDAPFKDPFWAFYWPGGQALTRYILDNPRLFFDKTVLDIGSGCGSAAIACRIVGAKNVIANDIDDAALTVIEMNVNSNDYNLERISLNDSNLLSQPITYNFNYLLMGDMFYDPEFADVISKWLKSVDFTSTSLLIGDPGRLSFNECYIKGSVRKLAEYELSEHCRLENNGYTHGFVWQYDNR